MSAEYPKIEKASGGGLKVHMTKGSSLPGVYINYYDADTAIRRVLSLQDIARNKKRGGKK